MDFNNLPPAQHYPQLQPSVPGAAYPSVPQEMYQNQQPPSPDQGQPPPQPLPSVVQVEIVTPQKLGHHPQTLTCPHCQATITTKIKAEASAKSWLIGLGICLLG